jgi:hypothetical protein
MRFALALPPRVARTTRAPGEEAVLLA